MARRHLINVGEGSIAGQALVEQRAKDGSKRETLGEFDLTASNIGRVQLDRVTVGRVFKKEEDRIFIMTKNHVRVEIFRSRLEGSFDKECDALRSFVKRNYVTFQDDLGSGVGS
jgi:hypothetical protein